MISRRLIATGLLTGALICLARKEAMAEPRRRADSAIETKVESAFQALRKGDATPLSAFPELGPGVVPVVGRYLDDRNEDVRGQAVAILAVVGGESSIPWLAKTLNDRSPELQERAAIALYDRYPSEAVAARKPIGTALRQSAGKNPTAAALLLLGHFPGRETARILTQAGGQRSRKTKLHPSDPPVSVVLPALIAGSRIGDQQARRALLERIESAPVEELRFLLRAIQEIDAPEVLLMLARTLDDSRVVGGGVPSGAAPVRRLCDLAVDSFVGRLALKVGFPLNSAGRYQPAQIEQVKRAIRGAIPQ